MNNQTVRAADFQKKPYAKPLIKAHQVKPVSLICTSPSSAKQNEEYEEVTTTSSWF